jgi:hypothetical protein
MNIHCSACGAPLPQGARFCPACVLPLTAIAMPTPAPRKRQVSTLAIVLCAFGILWAVAYASNRYEAGKAERNASTTSNTPSIGINQTVEQRLEESSWFSPRELRAWRAQVVEDEQHLRSINGPEAQTALRDDQAAAARIDARLSNWHQAIEIGSSGPLGAADNAAAASA